MTPEKVKAIQTNLDLGLMPSSVEVQQMLDVIKHMQEDKDPGATAFKNRRDWSRPITEEEHFDVQKSLRELQAKKDKK